MSHVVGAFGRQEEAERRGDEGADLLETPWPGRPKERFQLREGLLNRVEVGAVGREESHHGAHRLDGREHGRLFVHRQVIEHDDVPGSQRGDEDLFDIREKRRIVDWPVEHGGRAEPLKPQCGDHRVRLPMAARSVIVEPHAAMAPAIPSQQIGRHAAFVEEHVLPYIAERLPCLPLSPSGGDIRASLLGGVYRFF